jgi:DNA-3-methyladenine glycosylase I
MGGDVTVGDDGVPRCDWAGPAGTALADYHDQVWGTPTADLGQLFEALTLGVFEVGMSWKVVFGKRQGLAEAFHGFDAEQVAAMTGGDVDRLVQDPTVIRSRGKIQATIDNARIVLAASPSLPELVERYRSRRRSAPRTAAAVPTVTAKAEAFAKQLKAQGYRYVGPTSMYAFMQNVGMVNDHLHGCFRAADHSDR